VSLPWVNGGHKGSPFRGCGASFIGRALFALAALCSCVGVSDFLVQKDESICSQIVPDENIMFCAEHAYSPQDKSYVDSYYLLKDRRRLDVPGAAYQIYEMLTSPTGLHLALIENSGEGHPHLAIMSLKEILQGQEPRYTAGFDPYPGAIVDMHWEAGSLSFKSDTILPPYSEGTDEERHSYEVSYALDATTGRLEQRGEPRLIE